MQRINLSFYEIGDKLEAIKEIDYRLAWMYTEYYIHKCDELRGLDDNPNKILAYIVKCDIAEMDMHIRFAEAIEDLGLNNSSIDTFLVEKLKETVKGMAELLNDSECSVYLDPDIINRYKSAISQYTQKVKKYDAVFIEPRINSAVGTTRSSGSSGSGGCYIATAVYGSYDCPEVWVLRRYRDYTLAQNCFGRSFIRLYYAVSPMLIAWLGGLEWFKRFGKSQLDRIVCRLMNKGFNNSPYNR